MLSGLYRPVHIVSENSVAKESLLQERNLNIRHKIENFGEKEQSLALSVLLKQTKAVYYPGVREGYISILFFSNPFLVHFNTTIMLHCMLR